MHQCWIRGLIGRSFLAKELGSWEFCNSGLVGLVDCSGFVSLRSLRCIGLGFSRVEF